MRIDQFDLSTDRTAKPEPSQAARSGGIAVAQVIRCDSPASIHVDGASADAIPAVPGLVLENFTTLYVSNKAAGGMLVLAFYACHPGSPVSAVPFAREIVALEGINDAALTIDVDMPGPNWSMFISGIQYSQTQQGGTFAQVLAIQEKNVGAGFSDVFNGFRTRGLMMYQRDFTRPLITTPGRTVRFTADSAGAGVGETHWLSVFGGFIQ